RDRIPDRDRSHRRGRHALRGDAARERRHPARQERPECRRRTARRARRPPVRPACSLRGSAASQGRRRRRRRASRHAAYVWPCELSFSRRLEYRTARRRRRGGGRYDMYVRVNASTDLYAYEHPLETGIWTATGHHSVDYFEWWDY